MLSARFSASSWPHGAPPTPTPREQKLETGGTLKALAGLATAPLQVLLLNTSARVTETRVQEWVLESEVRLGRASGFGHRRLG